MMMTMTIERLSWPTSHVVKVTRNMKPDRVGYLYAGYDCDVICYYSLWSVLLTDAML